MTKLLGDTKQWFKDRGDTTHRLNYDLDELSMVVDIGAYKGDFTQAIHDKYKCSIHCYEPVFYHQLERRFIQHDNVRVFPFAVTDRSGEMAMTVNKDSSHQSGGGGVSVRTLPFRIVWRRAGSYIHLLKINIEGGEYTLLNYMINENITQYCDNIQVQFHKTEGYIEKYKFITQGLSRTHELTYRYPFVWENWKLCSRTQK